MENKDFETGVQEPNVVGNQQVLERGNEVDEFDAYGFYPDFSF